MKIDELSQKIKDALQNNTPFLEQIKVTLQVVSEQLNTLQNMQNFYKDTLDKVQNYDINFKELLDIKNDFDDELTDIDKNFSNLENLISECENKINNIKAKFNALNSTKANKDEVEELKAKFSAEFTTLTQNLEKEADFRLTRDNEISEWLLSTEQNVTSAKEDIRELYQKLSKQQPQFTNGVRLFTRLCLPFYFFFQYVKRSKDTAMTIGKANLGGGDINGNDYHEAYISPSQKYGAVDKYEDIFIFGENYSSNNTNILPQGIFKQITRLPFLYGEEISDLIGVQEFGNNHYYTFMALVKGANYMYVWGQNGYHSFGLGNVSNQAIPAKVTFSKPVKRAWINSMVWANYWIRVVELENGEVLFCGYNQDYQWGNGTNLSIPVFTKNNFFDGKELYDIEYGAGLVLTPIIKNKNGKLDIYAAGYKQGYNLYLPDEAKQTSFTLIAKDVSSYSINYAFYKPGDTAYCIAPIAYVKDKKAYIVGFAGKSVDIANAHNKCIDKAQSMKFRGKDFQNVKQVVIALYDIFFVLLENGELYLYEGEEQMLPIKNSIDENSIIEIKNFDNGFELVMKDIKEIRRVKQMYAGGFALLAITNSGDVYYLSQAKYNHNMDVINPLSHNQGLQYTSNDNATSMKEIKNAKLNLPIPWDEIIADEITFSFIGDNNFIGSMMITDGKRIWVGFSDDAKNNQIGLPYGFKPLELPQFTRKDD